MMRFLKAILIALVVQTVVWVLFFYLFIGDGFQQNESCLLKRLKPVICNIRRCGFLSQDVVL
jgi:hypothetical protein